jgi:Mn-dependent DtxR family transcriptional regulator
MARWPWTRGKVIREALVLELRKSGSGLGPELRTALARNELKVSPHRIERQLKKLAVRGLITRRTYVELTAAGYREAAELVRRQRQDTRKQARVIETSRDENP